MPPVPKPLDPKDLKDRLDGGEKVVILDVREVGEVSICRIDGAVHIPMNEIPARLGELDPRATIVVHCHHGMRSNMVGAYLLQQGFADVSNLSGGIARWADVVDPEMPRY